MSIIKERIKFNNKDINLKINLGITNRLSGYQQEIENLTEDTKDELINPVIDNEVRRFKHSGIQTITFNFNNNISFSTIGAGFTTDEITNSANVILNSFFIMEFYDTYDNNTQTKIFTTYLTKILVGTNPVPIYVLSPTNPNQLYHQYVPKSYLDSQTGSTITGYTRFMFYNAKTGVASLFYNSANNTPLSPKKMYFKTYLYPDTMTWNFDLSTVIAKQLLSTDLYAVRVNETFSNFNNVRQAYPEGTFNPEDGTYDGISTGTPSTTPATTPATTPSSTTGTGGSGGHSILPTQL